MKTAGGYLLILHTFEELSSSSEQLVRLLARAKDEGDWDLCKELARFLMALDETGRTLEEALEMVNLRSPQEDRNGGSFMFEGSRLKVPGRKKNTSAGSSMSSDSGHEGLSSSGSRSSTDQLASSVKDTSSLEGDYFGRLRDNDLD